MAPPRVYYSPGSARCPAKNKIKIRHQTIRFEGDYYQQCQAQGTVSNPQGPDTGVSRVIRGGGWYYSPRGCRAAYRNFGGLDYRAYFLGFRLVLQGGG